MSWQDQLNGDSLSWLLEEDSPGVRYLAMRDLAPRAKPADLQEARRQACARGPIANILKHMHPEGFWERPGPGYTAKYRGTDWSILLLAQLGASMDADARIPRACAYFLDHGFLPGGQFSTSTAPSGTVDCLQGNMAWALIELGCKDPRIDTAFEWMARTVTGEGMAPVTEKAAARRYYAYKCGPTFACGVNNGLPCGWGAVKVTLAMARLQEELRTPLIKRAIRQGADFLLSIDPATAAYPTRDGSKPNRAWWKFGFPIFYITDLLQLVEALALLGLGRDRRLAGALTLIRDKQDADGRWPLEYDYAGKTWGNYGVKRKPNKWVTLRALRVLKLAAAA
jgi:hypothetical protein